MDTTPARLTSSPDEVDMNAANAPAATIAPSTWPPMPGSIAERQQQHRRVGLAGDQQLRLVDPGQRAQ